jgi:hypothetical protein
MPQNLDKFQAGAEFASLLRHDNFMGMDHPSRESDWEIDVGQTHRRSPDPASYFFRAVLCI